MRERPGLGPERATRRGRPHALADGGIGLPDRPGPVSGGQPTVTMAAQASGPPCWLYTPWIGKFTGSLEAT
jgi:hypothetical protein